MGRYERRSLQLSEYSQRVRSYSGYERWIEDARRVFDKMPAETVMSRDILLTGNANSGEMLNSQHLLGKMPERDTVSWNAMIASYAKHGYDEEALKLFCRMYRLNMKLDHFTFGSILRVCAGMEALEQGQQ